MKQSRKSVVIALWANAALLTVILIALLMRGSSPSLLSAALAQQQAPIAGGAGVFIMPGQTAQNVWGCYLLDVDSQTICMYQWFPGEKQLRLVAARDYRFDRRLKQFNSQSPSPGEVRALVEKEQASLPGGGNAPEPRSR